MIAVFDTKVLIAAIITEGLCSKLLHRARAGDSDLLAIKSHKNIKIITPRDFEALFV